MKETMLALANLLSEALERTIGPDARFALVVWFDGDKAPTFTTSNEHRLETCRKMLTASAGMLSEAEVELYADHGPAGHA
jgi:hypothetical protein